MSMITEILFDVRGPHTCLAVAPSPDRLPKRSRSAQPSVRLPEYICLRRIGDCANLGVNPSLTICALTERAMSFIPRAGNAA